MREDFGTVLDTRALRSRQAGDSSVRAMKPGPSCEKARSTLAAHAAEQVETA